MNETLAHKAVNEVVYTLESFEIDYLKYDNETNTFSIVHVTDKETTETPVTLSKYYSEEDVLLDLVDKVIPTNFTPYIEKLYGRKPTWDTVNNVIFIGNPNGYYDSRYNQYKHARELGMEAVDLYEISLVEAVQQTIIAIRKLVK